MDVCRSSRLVERATGRCRADYDGQPGNSESRRTGNSQRHKRLEYTEPEHGCDRRSAAPCIFQQLELQR
jgi:hypothetical protein